jgi:hypothetical protein
VGVPSAVRDLAVHPFRELPRAPGEELIEQDGFLLKLDPFPSAQVVEPIEVSPETVQIAVESARGMARERGKSLLAWWIGPEYRDLEKPLAAAGLVHADTPGFEAVEVAMVLLRQPQVSVGEGIAVKQTDSYEEFFAGAQVLMEALDIPEAMREEEIAGMPKRWEEYTTPWNHGRQYIASIDGRIVGMAFAVFGAAGVNPLRRCRARGSARSRCLPGADRCPLGTGGRPGHSSADGAGWPHVRTDPREARLRRSGTGSPLRRHDHRLTPTSLQRLGSIRDGSTPLSQTRSMNTSTRLIGGGESTSRPVEVQTARPLHATLRRT